MDFAGVSPAHSVCLQSGRIVRRVLGNSTGNTLWPGIPLAGISLRRFAQWVFASIQTPWARFVTITRFF